MKKTLKTIVYWSTLVGPLVDVIIGTVKGFIMAVQSIREESKKEAEQFMFDNPDDHVVDLSGSGDAITFNNVVNIKDKK